MSQLEILLKVTFVDASIRWPLSTAHEWLSIDKSPYLERKPVVEYVQNSEKNIFLALFASVPFRCVSATGY